MSSWFQHSIRLREYPRGIHLITDQIRQGVPEIANCGIGRLHVFLQHTSASITINENASPEVRTDLDRFLNYLVPDSYTDFDHIDEGADDMPAHVKVAFVGNSLTIPVTNGSLALGTWQGLYLFEHRSAPHRREVAALLR